MTSLSFLSLHHGQPAAQVNAQMISILEAQGAIFFAHTMLPQAIMHLECESFWGRTLNPYNTSLTSGGSSGGEGALVSMRGSCLGIGCRSGAFTFSVTVPHPTDSVPRRPSPADIGGSIRNPAALCGIYGLRPTTNRVPNSGTRTYVPGRDSVLGVFGPLAISLRDIELLMQTLVGAEAAPWRVDPALLEMPWRGTVQQDRAPRTLRVGVMWDDGVVRPVKPVVRALQDVVATLQRSPRIEIVDFPAVQMQQSWEIIRRLVRYSLLRRYESH